MSVIYKITYPNGKIYVGQDRTDNINYFGSAQRALLEADFAREQRVSFSITRDILWQAEDVNRAEVTKIENEFILALRSNDPSVGYNRSPKFRGHEATVEILDN